MSDLAAAEHEPVEETLSTGEIEIIIYGEGERAMEMPEPVDVEPELDTVEVADFYATPLDVSQIVTRRLTITQAPAQAEPSPMPATGTRVVLNRVHRFEPGTRPQKEAA